MRKTIALLLCLMTVLGIFTGCDQPSEEAYVPTGDALVMEGQDPDSVGPQVQEEPQTFSLGYYPDRGMNPLTCNDFSNRVLFSLIYQNLFNVRADYSVEPILCKQYKVSSNYKIWSFYIEDRVTFSDGTPLTIQDVYDTFLAARSEGYYTGRFAHVADIQLNDQGGITFYLDTPYENLPQLLDIPILKSTEVAAAAPRGMK